MTNMTLLDVGASDGGFCYEALNRGAFYATALESREDRVEFMRHVRDTCQLAMGVAHLNIVSDTIPAIQVWETPRRYDVGLLLNVLHHMGTEEVGRFLCSARFSMSASTWLLKARSAKVA